MRSERRLILVRHSVPQRRAEVAPAEWRLSADGVARARALARQLDPGTATHVFSSTEPKAVETARAMAGEWQLPVEEVRGLHEHERPQPGLLTPAQFDDRVRDLFARPSEVVFGAESADAARRRFSAAVLRLTLTRAGDIIIVSHGTVMTLFVAEVAGVEPFAFWKGLGMPQAVTLTLPELAMLAESPAP